MQIEGNKAAANQLPVSTVGSEATGSGGSSADPGAT